MGAGALQYGASVEDALEKLQYDLFYIKNLSIALDLFIMFDDDQDGLAAARARSVRDKRAAIAWSMP